MSLLLSLAAQQSGTRGRSRPTRPHLFARGLEEQVAREAGTASGGAAQGRPPPVFYPVSQSPLPPPRPEELGNGTGVELAEEEGDREGLEAKEEGDNARVNEGMPMVVAFQDDTTERFRFLSFLASTTCSAS